MARTSSLPNDEYWEKRANQRMAAVERGTEPYLQSIDELYNGASGQVKADIEKILGTYMRNGQLTYDEAVKLLNDPLPEAEIASLRERAMLIEDPMERGKTLARLNAPSYAARIRRLEAVEVSAKTELAKIAPEQIMQTTKALTTAGKEAYQRTIFDVQRGTGYGYDFTKVTEQQIEEVLKQKWAGEHYSERIWANTDDIAARLPKIIQQNMTTGRSWQRCMDEIHDLVKKGGRRSAERILRTETAYVANEMEAQAYEDADIEQYKFVATLDNRTSPICQDHDGEIYDLADREPGDNYPPLHPYCRSTTIAEFDDPELAALERRARDKKGEPILVPADMTYKDWQKKYGMVSK